MKINRALMLASLLMLSFACGCSSSNDDSDIVNTSSTAQATSSVYMDTTVTSANDDTPQTTVPIISWNSDQPVTAQPSTTEPTTVPPTTQNTTTQPTTAAKKKQSTDKNKTTEKSNTKSSKSSSKTKSKTKNSTSTKEKSTNPKNTSVSKPKTTKNASVSKPKKVTSKRPKNSYYNYSNYKCTDYNNVVIKPKYVRYSGNEIIADCYVVNGVGSNVNNIDVKSFKLYDSKKKLICSADFGKLNNVKITPYGYSEWRFVFNADCIHNKKASLKKLYWGSATSFDYENNYRYYYYTPKQYYYCW